LIYISQLQFQTAIQVYSSDHKMFPQFYFQKIKNNIQGITV